MNRSDWLILSVLAVIWGGAFFFIGVAVRHVPPLTYVWLRLTIARGGACGLISRFRRRAARPAARGVGLDPAARAAQQCDSVHTVRMGPDAYRQRPRLDPQRDHPDLGRGRRAFPHPRRADEPAQDRRRAARLRRRRDDDRPFAAVEHRQQRAGPARLRRRFAQLCACRASGRGASSGWASRRSA